MSAAGRPASKPLDQELRRVARVRSFVGGRIVFHEGAYSYNCIVRDLSESGARVEIPAARLIPRCFFFLTSREEVAFDAELIWRTQKMAGMKFRQRIDLSTCADPKLRYLKRIAAELCPDARR
jgi:hypothetical protein